MPLYEYKCQNCGDVFEIIQRFSDQPLTVHEKCGGQVERLISVSALQFKGTGWYVTDYGKGNSKDPKPKQDGAQSDKSDKGEKKSNGTSPSSDSSGKSESSSSSDSSSSGKSDSSGKTDSSGKSDSSSSTASKPSASKTDSK